MSRSDAPRSQTPTNNAVDGISVANVSNNIRIPLDIVTHFLKDTSKHFRDSVIDLIMATNGNLSEEESPPGSPGLEQADDFDDEDIEEKLDEKPERKSALKKPTQVEPAPVIARPELPPQPDPEDLDIGSLTPLSPEIIARQATINIGTIGHVAHGKSTVVKAISGVQTVRFKNELERNITIKLGYANAKIYKCDSPDCPRPGCFRSFKSEKEVDPPCQREGCEGRYRLLRHVSYVFTVTAAI